MEGELTPQVEESLLRLVRGRLGPPTLSSETLAVHFVLAKFRDVYKEEGEAHALVRNRLRAAVESSDFDPDLRKFALAVMGFSAATSGSGLTRSRVLQIAGQVLPMRRVTDPADGGLSQRRLEQIERERLLPELVRAIGAQSNQRRFGTEWLDCAIRMKAHKVNEDAGRYTLRIETTVRRSPGEILLASLENESAADWLCSEYPDVFDVYIPAPGGSVTFSAAVRLPGEPWRVLDMPRDYAAASAMERDHPALRNGRLIVWGAANRPQVDHELKVTVDVELRLYSDYFYWTVPRRTFLKRFEADASALPLSTRDFEILPRLSRVADVEEDQAMRVFALELNDWVLPGNSIEVRWRRP